MSVSNGYLELGCQSTSPSLGPEADAGDSGGNYDASSNDRGGKGVHDRR
jgi:hypothetical protein